MSYTLLTSVEASDLIKRYSVRSIDLPSYGMVVKDGSRDIFFFRKTTGEILVVDVTGKVPAHFKQKFYPPKSFLDEVKDRIGSISTSVTEGLKAVLWAVAAVLAIVLISRR